MKKVVLAYSGGLDTSVCIPWLAERGYEVIAYMADVGQNKDLKPAIRRAKKAGASKVIVSDLRKEFVRDYLWPSVKADALYEGQYLLATALSRPLIAKEWVRIARRERARAVAHGCTGKGNDQVRFEVTAQLLAPEIEILAPVRLWDLKSRDQEIEYALSRQIPIDVTKKSPYSIDENLWGVSIECGVLEDPWTSPPSDCYVWTRGAEKRRLRPQSIVLEFVKGLPVGMNGKRMEPLRLIAALNRKAASFGIGRVDMIENRLVGIKSREIYESPAATLIHAAHRDLQTLTMDRQLSQLKSQAAQLYGRLVYDGLWFTPTKAALDAFVNATQSKVTGFVRLQLSMGTYVVSGRKSRYSRYRETLATYSEKDVFDQKLAKGFIDLFALPYRED